MSYSILVEDIQKQELITLLTASFGTVENQSGHFNLFFHQVVIIDITSQLIYTRHFLSSNSKLSEDYFLSNLFSLNKQYVCLMIECKDLTFQKLSEEICS